MFLQTNQSFFRLARLSLVESGYSFSKIAIAIRSGTDGSSTLNSRHPNNQSSIRDSQTLYRSNPGPSRQFLDRFDHIGNRQSMNLLRWPVRDHVKGHEPVQEAPSGRAGDGAGGADAVLRAGPRSANRAVAVAPPVQHPAGYTVRDCLRRGVVRRRRGVGQGVPEPQSVARLNAIPGDTPFITAS